MGKTLKKKDSEICDAVLALTCRGFDTKFKNEILTFIFSFNIAPMMMKSTTAELSKKTLFV